MIVKTIHEITNMMHASVHGDIDDTKKIHGVVIDSRQVTKDVLYVPIIGQRVDGHSFAKQTIEDGALISLWQKDHVPYPDFPVILVDDTLTTNEIQNMCSEIKDLKGIHNVVAEISRR